MGNKTDDKKTKKALARIRQTLRKKATLTGDAALSEWEDEFIDSLEQRLEKFGSAFADPEKGDAEQALSYRQATKLREVEKKAQGKARKPLKRSSFKPKKSMNRGKGFGNARRPEFEKDTNLPALKAPERPPECPLGPPKLTVISGGKSKP